MLKLNNFGQQKKDEKRKKRNEQNNDHHRWVVSYADFITLLFAFFVVMYAISSVNISKYKSLSEGMKSAFNKKDEARALKSTKSMKDGPQTTPFQGPFHDGLDELNQALIELQDGNYKINRQEGWVELDIKSGALFDSGDADLKPEAFVKLMQLAAKLKKSSSIVAVEGYTDNVPIETPQFPSNWELSAMRAAVVGRTLNSFGIATDRIFVTGYGEQYPVADNVTELGRAANRRVTIIIALNRNVPRLLNPAISEQDHSVIIGGKNKK
nr:flagellar motor protein MotB [Legionella bozemanae]